MRILTTRRFRETALVYCVRKIVYSENLEILEFPDAPLCPTPIHKREFF